MITAQGVRKLLTMLLVFVVCFSLAVFVVIRMLRGGSLENNASLGQPGSKKQQVQLFPDAITINRSDRFLRVTHRPEFIPNHKKEYLLLFWVNLKSLPAVGERLVLLSKYSGVPPKIIGYALGLSRDSNSIRPVLFWGDGSTAGRWYDFPEISIVPNQWNLFALHVHKDRFVGLYSGHANIAGASSVRFLGGHELDLQDPLNLGTADLIFGAPAGREFRGRLGPLAIINPLSIGFDNILPTLEGYLKNPLDLSELATESEIDLLITNGRSDSSKNKYDVITTY
jgi:hypothetical protein